jgi:hypothetical protein
MRESSDATRAKSLQLCGYLTFKYTLSVNLDNLLVKNMLRYPVWVAINITNTSWQTQLAWRFGRSFQRSSWRMFTKIETCFLQLWFWQMEIICIRWRVDILLLLSSIIPSSLMQFRIYSEKTFDRNFWIGNYLGAKLVTTQDGACVCSNESQRDCECASAGCR